MVKGDFVFNGLKNGWEEYDKKEYELITKGYVSVDMYFDPFNMYKVFKKGEDSIKLTVTSEFAA